MYCCLALLEKTVFLIYTYPFQKARSNLLQCTINFVYFVLSTYSPLYCPFCLLYTVRSVCFVLSTYPLLYCPLCLPYAVRLVYSILSALLQCTVNFVLIILADCAVFRGYSFLFSLFLLQETPAACRVTLPLISPTL